MSRAAKDFVLVTAAWLVGLGMAITLGLLLGVLVPGPAATFVSPLILGAIVGLAQRRVLTAHVRRGFVRLTALGALLGWLLGAFIGWRLHVSGHDALAPWANGPAVGVCVGVLQIIALNGSKRTHVITIATTTLGWSLAIGLWLVPGVAPAVRLAGFAIPGLFVVAQGTMIELSRPVIGGAPSAGGVSAGNQCAAE